MDVASADEVGQLPVYARDPVGQVAVLNSLAGHYMQEAEREMDLLARKRLMERAAEKYVMGEKKKKKEAPKKKKFISISN